MVVGVIPVSSRVAPFYPAKAARFAGAVSPSTAPTNYMTRTSLSGSGTSSQGIVSFWVRCCSPDNGVFYSSIFSRDSGDLFSIKRRRAEQTIYLQLANPGFTSYVVMDTLATFPLDGAWQHVMCSWDTAFSAGSRLLHMYVNGVSSKALTLDVGTSFNVNYATIVDKYYFAATVDQQSYEIAEFFFTEGAYLDLSILANRRKVISASRRPVLLGADGSRLTGTQPLVYFKGNGSGFNVNSGSGGNFTTTGTLTTPTTTPSSP